MDKERETGDGTLDRFSHYPYAPSSGGTGVQSQAQVFNGTRNLPPVIGISDPSHAVPVSNLTKRNQLNLSAYTFPPGFVDANSDDLNQVIKQTIAANSKVVDLPVAAAETTPAAATDVNESNTKE